MKSGPTAAATPEPKAAPKPAPPPEVKPEPKPQPGAVVKRPSAPVAAASRFEEPFGKQPETLAGYLKDDPARLEEVIHALATTADALARLHAAQARIEPLTPQSIRFDEVGKASIVNSQAITSGSGGVVGNPRYAVPEIFADSGAESNLTAAHVYALGFMFYEILIGRKLFEKTLPQQRTDLDWLRWHADLEAKLPAAKSLLPGCPDALSDLLVSMTDKHWDKRITDLQAICSTIRSVARRSDQTVIRQAPTVRSLPVVAKPKAPVEPPSAPKKKSRKGLFIVLVLLLALAVGALVLWQNPDLYRDVLSHFSHRAQTNRSAPAAAQS
jgi:serine/threonine protein kinase